MFSPYFSNVYSLSTLRPQKKPTILMTLTHANRTAAMLTTIELVDLAKKKTGSESDGQLARRLHLHRATVSQWRTGRSGPSDAVALSLADATRLPSEYVLACCAAARSDCPLAAEHWARIARVLARHYELDLFRDTEGMRRGPLPL